MACGKVKSAADVRALSALGIDVAVMGQSAISTPDFPKEVNRDPGFAVSVFPPYDPDFLARVEVTPPFVEFMQKNGWAHARL